MLLAVVSALLVAGVLGSTTALADPPPDAFRFVHDADGRLKAAIDPEGDTATYSWDAAGNLLSIGRSSSAKLAILQLSPAKGAVGETIDIEGTGFSETPGSNTVKFNGTAATVEAATPWSLSVKVPAEATSGTLTVQTSGEGPVTSAQSFTVAASAKPSISSLEPTVADVGDEVTVSGSNFGASAQDNIVTVNAMRPGLVSASTSSLSFEVAADRLGGRVSVSTMEGSATGPDLFVPPDGLKASGVGATGRFSLGDSKTAEMSAGKAALMLFDGSAEEEVSLTLKEATVDGSVSIWSPGGTQLAGSSVNFSKGGGTVIAGPVTLPSTGTYTVLFRPSLGGSGSVKVTSYGFQHLTGAIVPTIEGAQKSVSITTPGQEARYSIAATAGQGASLKNDQLGNQRRL